MFKAVHAVWDPLVILKLTKVPAPARPLDCTSSKPTFAVEVYAPEPRIETIPFVATMPAVAELTLKSDPEVIPDAVLFVIERPTPVVVRSAAVISITVAVV